MLGPPQSLSPLEIEVIPEPGKDERAVLLEALTSVPELPEAYESAWRLAALREGIEGSER